VKALTAFASGVLFAVGLCVSGMTHPSKVIAFLDFTGQWDPSLAFVMLGAIGVHALFVRYAVRVGRPLFDSAFALAEGRSVDGELVAGAAIFGVGWGLAGYCPGPAVVSVAAFGHNALTFVAAMVFGMLLYRLAPVGDSLRSAAADG
jgi:uncharacterized membrane protein YedE/YeeE